MQSNWTIDQTKKLFSLVYEANEQQKGLMWAFSRAAVDTGRSVNSVRNYYYAQLKMFELVPKLADDLGIRIVNSNREQFELFNGSEIENLVKSILKAKAEGVSVRATITRLSKGDAKLALRLQNKYRAMIKHHRHKVGVMMQEMTKAGEVYFNPYSKKVVSEDNPDNHKKLADYVSGLDEREVENVLNVLQKLFA